MDYSNLIVYCIGFHAIYKYYTVSVFDITTHHTYIISLVITIIIIILYYLKSLFLCLELQNSQTLLMIEKKASLAKSQQITDLKEKLKLTSTLSLGLY